MTSTVTAKLTTINEETSTGWWDSITIYSAEGETLDCVFVMSSEDPADYSEAMTRAGYGDVPIINGAA